MLTRCYSPVAHRHQESYKGSSCCEEWLTFSNFKSWMETQDWKGKQLDKDLLFRDNKHYSPSTCVFVDRLTNNFFSIPKVKNSKLPVGVSQSKPSFGFKAECSQLGNGKKVLGIFPTLFEARLSYLNEKLRLAKILAEFQTDSRVSYSLISRCQQDLEDFLNG